MPADPGPGQRLAPTAYTSASAGTATRKAVTALPATYARPDSAVSRSCRVQPIARSPAIRPPMATAAAIAPKTDMLTMIHAVPLMPSWVPEP